MDIFTPGAVPVREKDSKLQHHGFYPYGAPTLRERERKKLHELIQVVFEVWYEQGEMVGSNERA